MENWFDLLIWHCTPQSFWSSRIRFSNAQNLLEALPSPDNNSIYSWFSFSIYASCQPGSLLRNNFQSFSENLFIAHPLQFLSPKLEIVSFVIWHITLSANQRYEFLQISSRITSSSKVHSKSSICHDIFHAIPALLNWVESVYLIYIITKYPSKFYNNAKLIWPPFFFVISRLYSKSKWCSSGVVNAFFKSKTIDFTGFSGIFQDTAVTNE